jgi:CHAT domain-containing protein/tetratricopeptide (TPR) repeat protein
MKQIIKLKIVFGVFIILAFTLTSFGQTLNADKKRRADIVFGEAEGLFQQGIETSYRAALVKFKEASRLYQEIGDNSEIFGITLLASGLISYKLGDNTVALNFYRQALIFFRYIKSETLEASTLNNIGLVNESLGEKQEALKFYDQALQLFIKVGNLGGQAMTLNNVGEVYTSLGEKQKALEFLIRALSLRTKASDIAGLAMTLNNIGSVYSDLGDKQKALDFYNQALPLRIKVADFGGQATTQHNIGSIYDSLGEKQEALKFYSQALRLFIKVGNVSGQANTLNDIGSIYFLFGEKQKALECYNKVLPLAIQVGNVGVQASTYNNIGGVYSSLGEKQKALEFYNQALPLTIKIGDVGEFAVTLNNVGEVYTSLGEKQEALKFYNQALLLCIKVGNVGGQAKTLSNIGTVYFLLGEKQKALEFYNQALPLQIKVGDVEGQATTFLNIGGVYSNLGEKQKALEFYNQAVSLSIRVGDADGQAGTLNNLMYVWASLKNNQFAVFYGKQSVNRFQELRQNIGNLAKENQQTYLKSINPAYRKLTDIFITEGRFAEAQQTLNLFKDQQFFDFNRNPNEPIKQLTQTPRETEFSLRYHKSSEQVGKIGSEFDELKRTIGTRQSTADETTQLQKLESNLKTATDDFLAVLKQAETEFSKPADDNDKVGEIADTREMQTALRTLNEQTGQKTVAVYTLVGEDNFRALIVSPDAIKAVSSPIKGTELNTKALKLWGLLQSPNYDTTVLSKQIYEAVFKPIEAALPKDTTTIMWSLDGNLRYLPPAALWDGKRFLAERYNHVIFTRADAERMTRAVNPIWTGTGFGTSEAKTVDLFGDGSKINFVSLLGVKQELQSIFVPDEKGKTIVTGDILSDAQFTKDKFYEVLKKRRPLVHISSHFSFRPGDEARSFLLMGDGSALTLNELKKQTTLFQGVDLLTLSACNTAATQSDANGREIDGFAELAQRLGAGAVMATLWQVSDASTPWLMREFYTIRQSKTGMTKAEALKKAQLSLLNGTAEVKPLPNVAKSQSQNQVKVVIVQKGSGNKTDNTRSDVIYLDESQAPPYKSAGKPKYAHPYYWSPFVLYGNWK